MDSRITDYFVVWVAYNEEKTLEKSFLAAKRAMDFYCQKTLNDAVANVVICHNGCTDRTPEVALEIKRKHTNEKITVDVISSAKGMVIAQNAAISYIREKKNNFNNPIIFIDADSFIGENTIDIFLNQFIKHPKLKAVGARPVPIPYDGPSPIKRFWDKVLNCRAYYPKAEIAVNYAPEFHPYADEDPQGVEPEFEKRSKIYFHGRCFAIRDQSVWDVEKGNIGEDTYLDRSIHYKFGPGSIRTVYSARVYFKPITSIRVFAKTFHRIYRDLKELKRLHPEYLKVREYSKTKLDWEYIEKLTLKWRIRFRVYHLVRQFFHLLSKHNLIYGRIPVLELWSYNQK